MNRPNPEGNSSARPPTLWERAKGRIVGLTGVLLVLPALVNAGYDIYAAIAKLPRTEKEKINVEMFEKYFKKPPKEKVIVPIQSVYGTVEATFQIFEEGDIFVEFGKHTQWFKFPRVDQPMKLNWVPLISSANAAEVSVGTKREGTKLEGSRIWIMNSSITASSIVRSQATLSGSVVTDKIDIRTGNILSSEMHNSGSISIGNSDTTTSVRRLGVIVIGN